MDGGGGSEGSRGNSHLRQGGGNDEREQSGRTFRWKPNETCLELLLSMGIDRNSAIKGLYYTGNHSAEFAASYVFDHPEIEDDVDQSMRIMMSGSQKDITGALQAADFAGEIPHYKMVFVVNTSLGMTIGKTAAQIGHAAVGLFRRLSGDKKVFGNQLLMWEEEGEKKVVVRGEDVAHLREIEKQAMGLGLPLYMVQDAGLTEVSPTAFTVLAIFGREETVNSVTGKLYLL